MRTKAAKLVNSLTTVANKNILDPEAVFQAGQSLLAFGENADKLPDVLNRIALISRATGKDFNELATIYGKARTAGKRSTRKTSTNSLRPQT